MRLPINHEVTDRDFFLGCSMGLVPHTVVVNRFGRNPDVDTVAEDIWANGGDWTPLAAARVHNIVSTSAADTSAGTGARTVLLEGLDANYAFQTETITLNGLTNVPTVGSYIFIDRLTVVTAGSGAANAGAITATSVTEATVQCNMAVGFNRTQLGWYMIPAGYTGYLLQWDSGLQQATASAGVDVGLFTRAAASNVFILRDLLPLYTGGTSHAHHKHCLPVQLDEKSIVKARCINATNSNNDIHVKLGILLVKNEPAES